MAGDIKQTIENNPVPGPVYNSQKRSTTDIEPIQAITPLQRTAVPRAKAKGQNDPVYELAVVQKHAHGTKRQANGEIYCGDMKKTKIMINDKDLNDLLGTTVDAHLHISKTSGLPSGTKMPAPPLSRFEVETQFWKLLVRYLTTTNNQSSYTVRSSTSSWDIFARMLCKGYARFTTGEILVEASLAREHLSRAITRVEKCLEAYSYHKCEETLSRGDDASTTSAMACLCGAMDLLFRDKTESWNIRKRAAFIKEFADKVQEGGSGCETLKPAISWVKVVLAQLREIETHLSSHKLPERWTGCSYFHPEGRQQLDMGASPPTKRPVEVVVVDE